MDELLRATMVEASRKAQIRQRCHYNPQIATDNGRGRDTCPKSV